MAKDIQKDVAYVLQNNPTAKKVYSTTDGTIFLNEGDAQKHANKTDKKVTPWSRAKEVQATEPAGTEPTGTEPTGTEPKNKSKKS